MFLLPHLPFLWYLTGTDALSRLIGPYGGIASLLIHTLLILAECLSLFMLHIFPYISKDAAPVRIKIMYGGRRLLHFCFYGILFQVLFYLLFFIFRIPVLELLKQTVWLCVLDAVFVVLHFYLLILNGSIRILATCRRLGIGKRLFIIFTLWIPVFNLFLLKYLCRKAEDEFDQERCRFCNRLDREGSQICATKYPVILVHGIGFRDLQYFNYWGRIPKELVRNGATVYYGHQEAWGTIENNAKKIKDTINSVLTETNCGRVNLIAHSKGGLDARYLIDALNMEDRIASLTTISTPHRGSELIDVLNRLPDGIYRLIASLLDRSYQKLGDHCPDCYHSSKQLSPGFCLDFNEKYPDSSKVYYQSYASVVKHTFGDSLLSIPNLLMFFAGADKNDGLVTEGSAKWGTFMGTFASSGKRGISHGDMIDLKREDYKGFDVIEAYIKIVKDLKDKGF